MLRLVTALRAPRLAAVAAVSVLTAVGCAPQDDAGASSSASSSSSSSSSSASCSPGALATRAKGELTVGTDKPAYEPWFSDDKPSNGKGYESAVAYAVAKRLGYPADKVVWQTVPFNNAISPGEKAFDFDINQVSITPEREKAVDFSSGYYDVRQAVIALKSSKAASATSIADLKKYKLGAQIGTTSLDLVNDVIKPSQSAAVYQKNDLAVSALKNGQVDAIVTDLPTAFYITAAEVTDARIVGQYQGSQGKPEQFGLVLDKGSRLTPCVSKAVDALRTDGTLARLEKQWLSDAADAPVIK
jgi:polar amino acid transport system substrate-binding protein